MAITAVGGATAGSAVAVNSLSVTYSPTAGNCVIIVLSANQNIAPILKDSAGNTIPPDDNSNGTPYASGQTGATGQPRWAWHVNGIAAGITGFTASWTGGTAAICAMAVQEYSGSDNNAVGPIGATYVSRSTAATGSVTIPAGGGFGVAAGAAVSSVAVTITAGTQRQNSGAFGNEWALIADNTSASDNTSVSVTESGVNAALTWFMYVVGSAGRLRLDQNVPLVLRSPSNARIRVAQDFALVLKSPSNARIRFGQQVILVLVQNSPQKTQPFCFVMT